MANLPISGLTPSAADLAATDVLPVVQTTGVGPVKMTGTQIKTGIIGAGSVSIASGKTFTSSNTLTLAGTDGTTMTFPSTSATIARTDAGNTFTGNQTITDVANPVFPTLQVTGGSNTTGIALTTVAITGTGGQFSCDAATLTVGQTVTISGTLGGTGAITGYSNPTTYRISATNGSTTFTLVNASTGAALTTTAGTPTGLTYTVTAPILNLTQTWNNSAVAFTGLRFNATDTLSNASSSLLDLQVGASTKFRVRKDGRITLIDYYNISPVGTELQINCGFSATFNITLANSPVQLKSSGGGGIILGNSGVGRIAIGNALNAGVDLVDFFVPSPCILQLGQTDAGSVTATVTITIASPAVVTWASGAITTGTPVFFTTTGALPTGITANTTYYAIRVDNSSFRIATSYADALAGTAIDTSGTQSGTHTGNRNAISQTLRVQNVTGVADRPGADFAIQGSRGTGTGAGGSIIFQVAPAGSSGTAQNAYATALTLNSSKQAIFDAGTVALPSILFRASDTIGIYSRYNGCITISDGSSVNMFDFANTSGSNGAFSINSGGFIQFCSGGAGSTGGDTVLRRDAANTLALRNGTNAQTFNVYGSYTSTTNYQRVVVKTLREVSSALSGATYVSTIAIPAYAVLIGVTTRVTTAVTGATSYDVGDGTNADLWGAAIGVTLGSQSRTADFTDVAATGAAATSRTVTLTANGSNFTGGVVEICLHYLTTEAD